MMIEERVGDEERAAGCSTRATVLLPWRLGRTHAARNGVLTECVVRPSQASNGVEGTGLVARTFLPIHQI